MERSEADARLADAIRDHAHAYDLADSGEQLVDFAICAAWQAIETEGEARYTTAYSTYCVPTHVAVGLFRVGEAIANGDDE